MVINYIRTAWYVETCGGGNMGNKTYSHLLKEGDSKYKKQLLNQADTIKQMRSKITALELKLSQSAEREGKALSQLKQCYEYIKSRRRKHSRGDNDMCMAVYMAIEDLKQITEQKEIK